MPTPQPLLSVVIPAYNEKHTLRVLVNKVLEVPIDKEVIVVDDGSTDGTRDIVAEIAEQSPLVRALYGRSRTRRSQG